MEVAVVVGMNDERGVENVGVGGREFYADAGVRQNFSVRAHTRL